MCVFVSELGKWRGRGILGEIQIKKQGGGERKIKKKEIEKEREREREL